MILKVGLKMKLSEYGKWTRIKVSDGTYGFKIMVHKGLMQAKEIRTRYPRASMYSHVYHGRTTTFTLGPI